MAGDNSKSTGIGGDELSMPIAYIGKDDEGSTGMRFFAVEKHSEKSVAEYILNQVQGYDPYEPRLFDCEDQAFLAASDVRCKYLGQPVAIALGKAKEDERMKGQSHALLVLWFRDQVGGTKWIPKFFDPTLKRFVDDFDTQVLIPLPTSGSTKGNQNLKFEKNLPLLETAAFALDGRNYDYIFKNKNEVQIDSLLKSKGLKECKQQRTLDENDKILDPAQRYWSPIDRVFWHFAHLRQTHKGAPIGFAVGMAKLPGSNPFEKAALVLWKQADDFIYWDIDFKDTLASKNMKFEPRIVIV
jgi:hypothetical protein